MTADDDPTLLPDPERTALIPRPGGVRPTQRGAPPRELPRPQPATAQRPPADAGVGSAATNAALPGGVRPLRRAITKPAGLELQRLVAGLNPLLGAANLLLTLVPRLRATTHHDDPAALQQQLIVRVHEFELHARNAGVPRPRLSAARYVLCSFLDEVIAATPWGAARWEPHTLIGALHEERWGAEKAFQLLERLERDLEGHRDVLELFYVCLALGFEGRWKDRPDGRAQLQALRARLHDLLRPEPVAVEDHGRALSPQWAPAPVPERSRLAALPWWLAPAVAGALMLGIVLALQWRVDRLAQPVYAQLHEAAARLRVPLPAAAAEARLAPALPASWLGEARLVEDARQSRLVLPAEPLFAAGTARLAPGQPERLAPLAQALRAQPGSITVSGHTDAAHRASLQFPSNWELSRAWAEAVVQALVAAGVPAERVRAEGRADSEAPVGDAPARRVEITLRLPRPTN